MISWINSMDSMTRVLAWYKWTMDTDIEVLLEVKICSYFSNLSSQFLQQAVIYILGIVI